MYIFYYGSVKLSREQGTKFSQYYCGYSEEAVHLIVQILNKIVLLYRCQSRT